MSETQTNLRGNTFIGEDVKWNGSSDKKLSRICGLCFYREDKNTGKGDCVIITEPHPKNLFDIDSDVEMPKILEGAQVGNYCPYFLGFDAE